MIIWELIIEDGNWFWRVNLERKCVKNLVFQRNSERGKIIAGERENIIENMRKKMKNVAGQPLKASGQPFALKQLVDQSQPHKQQAA